MVVLQTCTKNDRAPFGEKRLSVSLLTQPHWGSASGTTPRTGQTHQVGTNQCNCSSCPQGNPQGSELELVQVASELVRAESELVRAARELVREGSELGSGLVMEWVHRL